MIWDYILYTVVAYLLGAIPFALIWVKLLAKKNVLSEGSGNVGAMNSYDISGKKWLGILVMLSDVAKGFLAPFIVGLISEGNYFAISLASVFVVLGHNYNIFLGFRGGRGLSSAAGVCLYVNLSALILWFVLFSVVYFSIKKDLHIASFFGTLLMPVVILIAPDAWVTYLNMFASPSPTDFLYVIIIVITIILARHVEPIMKLINDSD